MKFWKKIKERIYRISPTYRLLRKFVFNVSNELESQKREVLILKKVNEEILNTFKKKDDEKSSLPNVANDSAFGGHYNEWRQKRISAYIKHYGINWFKDKTILEIGCGYAGNIFYYLGADVTVSDARKEHLRVINERYPHLTTIQHDCEEPLPFKKDKKFDLIIHNGLLYHLDNYEANLENCINHCKYMVLETEVCDSDSKEFVLKINEPAESFDQSFRGVGSRPSPSNIEDIIEKKGASFKRLEDDRCNSGFHIYNRKIENTKLYTIGHRRIYFIKSE